MAFAIACTSSSHGASILAANTPDLSGNAAIDFFIENAITDTLLASGYAGSGGFSISDADVTIAVNAGNFAALAAAFVPFIGTDDFNTGMVGSNGGATAGAYSIPNDPFVVTPYLGQTLYTIIGNSTILANSTAFALFRHTEVLVADPGGTATPNDYILDLTPADGTLLAGTRDTLNGFSDPFFDVTGINISTVKLITPIPEPSALLLSAFGVLGLLRRKR